MPAHGLLSCSIELGESRLCLREYGTTYANKTVETFVAIPSQPAPFSICFITHGYIAPGLSIFLFIDGVYQTNRNKRSIKQPTIGNPTAANFKIRLGQKENLLKDGRVIARGWWFEKLNIVPADTKPTINEDILNNIGTIEVVVLRCQDDPINLSLNPWDFPKLPDVKPKWKPSESSSRLKHDQKATPKTSNRKEPSDDGVFGRLFSGFDGAGDDPFDMPMGLDGQWDRDTGRPRLHRYDRSRRGSACSSNSGKYHYDEDDPMTTTPSSDGRDLERHVRFINATPDRERREGPTGSKPRHGSPLSSRRFRHERESSIYSFGGSRGRTPERSASHRDRYGSEFHAEKLHRTKRDSRQSDEPLVHKASKRRKEFGWGSMPSSQKEREKQEMVEHHDAVTRSLAAFIENNSSDPRKRSSPLVTEYFNSDEDEGDDYSRSEEFSEELIPPRRASGYQPSRTHDISPTGGWPDHSHRQQRAPIPKQRHEPAHTGGYFDNPEPPRSGPTPHAEGHQPAGTNSLFGKQTSVPTWPPLSYPTRPQGVNYGFSNTNPHQYGLGPTTQQADASAPGPLRQSSGQYDHQHQNQWQHGSTPSVPQGPTHGYPKAPAHHYPQAPAHDRPHGPAHGLLHGHQHDQHGHLQYEQQHGYYHGSAHSHTYGPAHGHNQHGHQHGHQHDHQQGCPQHDHYSEQQPEPSNRPPYPQHGPQRHEPSPSHSHSAQYPQMVQGQQTDSSVVQQLLNEIQQLNVNEKQMKQGNRYQSPARAPSGRSASQPTSGAWPKDGNANQCMDCNLDPWNSQDAYANCYLPANQSKGGKTGGYGNSSPNHRQCRTHWGTFWRPGNGNGNTNPETQQNSAECTCNQGTPRNSNEVWNRGSYQSNGGDRHFGQNKIFGSTDWGEAGANNWGSQGNQQSAGNSAGNFGVWGNESKGQNEPSSNTLGNENKGSEQPHNAGWDSSQSNNTTQQIGDAAAGWNSNTNDQKNKTSDGWNNNTSGNWNNDNKGVGGNDKNSIASKNNSDANNGKGGWGDQNQNGDKDDWGNLGSKTDLKSDKEKSSKSKSMQISAVKDENKPAPVQEKPWTRSYWKGEGVSADAANSGKKRGLYTMPEDPIYTVSESKAKEFNVKHQVRGGKGSEQIKKTYQPLYWDNFDEPYAVFRFKYRSRDMLKKILGEDIQESTEELKEWLGALSKDQLIAEMVKQKESGAWKSDDNSDDASDSVSKKDAKDKGKSDEGGGGDASWDTSASEGNDCDNNKDWGAEDTTTPTANAAWN